MTLELDGLRECYGRATVGFGDVFCSCLFSPFFPAVSMGIWMRTDPIAVSVL